MPWLHKVISNEGDKILKYPRKGVIHAFQAKFVVQENWEKRNLGDELLLVDSKNSSSPKFVNSQKSDYNRPTNLPFMY
jgi:hypothetical protein